MKEDVIKFFKPDKSKLILASSFFFILPLGYILLVIILALISGEGYSEILDLIRDFFQVYSSSMLSLGIFKLIWGWIVFSIIFYPLSCSLIAIYRLFKRGEIRAIRRNKTTFFLIMLGISLLNPITLYGGYSIKTSLEKDRVYKSEPKVEVTAIELGSPFDGTILKVGDQIIRAEIYQFEKENYTGSVRELAKETEQTFIINNSQDFYAVLDKVGPGYVIRIIALGKNIDYRIYKNITDWGIKVKDR